VNKTPAIAGGEIAKFATMVPAANVSAAKDGHEGFNSKLPANSLVNAMSVPQITPNDRQLAISKPYRQIWRKLFRDKRNLAYRSKRFPLSREFAKTGVSEM
jgi:hypothetical protein